jgi:glycosyltransferase involved in cell wall biosynthesis
MKIVLVCEAVFPENKGGLERWMLWLANQFRLRGYQVTYINAAGVNEFRNGIKFISVSKKSWHYVNDGKRSILQSVKFALKILPIVRNVGPDLIYCVQAPIFSIFTLAMIPKRKWILVVEWIEIWSRRYWMSYLGPILGSFGFLLQRWAMRFGDYRVVFTPRCLKQLGLNKRGNLLLPGLHMNASSIVFPKFVFKNDIIFLGRFVAEKQPLLAISSVEQFHKMGWNGIFYIVGTGPLKMIIENEILIRKMSSYVHLIENASQTQLDTCFSRSFVLLHPSKREGYGLAMIEAAEKGIPTILINYPENASVDLGISTEFVTQSEDPNDIAKLLNQAYSVQEGTYSKLKDWVSFELPKIDAIKSVDELISTTRIDHSKA